MDKQRVIFVCTHNASRSQMAHGLLRHAASDRFEVQSAGVEPGTVHPLAVKAMAEIGSDIAGHVAEGIDVYQGKFDYDAVILVCHKAADTCPVDWPGARQRLHWFFDDPSAATGSQEERLAVFRRVRDQIAERIDAWVEAPAST